MTAHDIIRTAFSGEFEDIENDTDADSNDFDAVEWGTLEGGKLDRKVWNNSISE